MCVVTIASANQSSMERFTIRAKITCSRLSFHPFERQL